MKPFILSLLLVLAAMSANASPRLDAAGARPCWAGEGLALARDFQAAGQETCCELVRKVEPVVRDPFWAAGAGQPEVGPLARPVTVFTTVGWLGTHAEPAGNPASPRDPPTSRSLG